VVGNFRRERENRNWMTVGLGKGKVRRMRLGWFTGYFEYGLYDFVSISRIILEEEVRLFDTSNPSSGETVFITSNKAAKPSTRRKELFWIMQDVLFKPFAIGKTFAS